MFDGPCLEASTRVLEGTSEALVEWLQSFPSIESGPPFPLNVGGYPGIALDIALGDRLPECETELPPELKGNVWLFPVGDTSFHLRPDEAVRVVVVDLGARPITLLIGSLEAADFDSLVEAPPTRSLRRCASLPEGRVDGASVKRSRRPTVGLEQHASLAESDPRPSPRRSAA